MIHRYFLFIFILFQVLLVEASQRDTLDLAGEWNYLLIGAPSYIPGEGEMKLPNTLDNSHKSVYNPESDNTTQLRREYAFVGDATYYREIFIPEDWEDKQIELIIERTKPAIVNINGVEVGHNSRISSPQRFNVTDFLSPGKHILEISVNNADSIPPIVARSSHAVSESTQTNWNGILGDLVIEAKNQLNIRKVVINDSVINDEVKINVTLSQPASSSFSISLNMDGKIIATKSPDDEEETIEFKVPVEKSDLWSASSPKLHNLSIVLKDHNEVSIDEYKIKSGFREFKAKGNQFMINHEPVFLRGTVNAAVFPETGYSPVDLQSWLDYFRVVKNYGLNHVRFHSWTPPEAAFCAADSVGIYILAELPIWGELDRDLQFHNRFLKEELQGIMDSYAYHPSFVMFSTGNELFGDLTLMREYMKEAKKLNPRLLTTYGSNIYLGMHGEIGDEDFLLAAKTGDDIRLSIRGSDSFADTASGGHFNSSSPNSDFNFSEVVKNVKVPIISHEVGQYQSYPSFSEIEKYQGNLKPDNLKEFQKRAEKEGTLRKSDKFHEASGKWVTKLYKAEMEMAQRTPGMAGFELFGLQDYPGQGTALVGVLDPFMESKGFITPEKWRQSAADILLLAEFPKFTFVEEENLTLPLNLLNYTINQDSVPEILWGTGFSKGRINVNPYIDNKSENLLTIELPKVSRPEKETLFLYTSDGLASNEYDFWIYPKEMEKIDNVVVTTDIRYALSLLEKGKKVLLCPDSATVSDASLAPLFTTDFWNYRMFRTICDEMNLIPSPGTLGLLVNNEHPALKNFPSDIHSDWQWFPIITNSRTLIIDRLPKDFDPIVEVIDNVERNFRLALLLECKVGKGKLMILSADPDKLEESPEGRWLLQSLKIYMTSKDFKPTLSLKPSQVINLLTKPSTNRKVKELKNETYNSNWD